MGSVNLTEIGARICAQRKQLGLTQEQLAAMMDVSVQMISNLERGNKSIRIENLIKLSKLLGVSTDYILTGLQNSVDAQLMAAQISQLCPEHQALLKVIIDHYLQNS